MPETAYLCEGVGSNRTPKPLKPWPHPKPVEMVYDFALCGWRCPVENCVGFASDESAYRRLAR